MRTCFAPAFAVPLVTAASGVADPGCSRGTVGNQFTIPTPTVFYLIRLTAEIPIRRITRGGIDHGQNDYLYQAQAWNERRRLRTILAHATCRDSYQVAWTPPLRSVPYDPVGLPQWRARLRRGGRGLVRLDRGDARNREDRGVPGRARRRAEF